MTQQMSVGELAAEPGESDISPSTERPARSLTDVLAGRPGWPLVLLFVGYPLWWVLGIADIMTFVAAAGMAYELLRTPTIRVPKNIGVLLLFLAWVALGILLVKVDVPGAVAGGGATRYFTWAWRLLWYLKATILLLYLGNQRNRLSLTWICRIFGWMFVVLVAGGVVGVVAPHFQLQSFAEIVLPRSLSAKPFVHSLIHPVAAEDFTLLGGEQGRTSAPFAYSNVWGQNFACFLPFFLVGWFGHDAGWRRVVGPVVLAVAAVPVVFSLNRALWAALIVAAVFVAVRSALAGRTRALGAIAVGSIVVVALLTLSPLGRTAADRLHGNGPTSNAGRAGLSALSLSSMEHTSPLVGFGTTRNVQGNFDSIAGGATAFCPRCALPALGTQGQISLVTFTQGIIGAILYFGFLAVQFVRHLRVRSGFAVAGLTVLLVHFVTSSVYSADNLSILAIFAAIALMWRAGIEQSLGRDATTPYAPDEPVLSDYRRLVGEHRKALAVLSVAGVIGGAGVAYAHGTSYAARTSVVVPDDPVYDGPRQPPTTLDTIAATATSTTALTAMRAAPFAGHGVSAERLAVTATPNTRILHLTYIGTSAPAARSVVGAAAQSVLAQRLAALKNLQNLRLAALGARNNAILAGLQTITASAGSAITARGLTPVTDDLHSQLNEVSNEIMQVQQLPLDPGGVTEPVTIRAVHDTLKIDVANGLGLALLIWIGFALTSRAVSPRVTTRARVMATRGLPLLACGGARTIDSATMITLHRPAAFIAVGTSIDAAIAAARLDSQIARPERTRSPRRVILVSVAGDRMREVVLARRRLEHVGAQIAGLVVVDGRTARTPSDQRPIDVWASP